MTPMAAPRKWDVLRRRVIWILLILLVPSFILFFHAASQQPETGPGGTAGVLFGKKIPWNTYETHRAWLQRQLEVQLGDQVPPELLQLFLTQAVWDRLILLEEAKRSRTQVDDVELASFIQSIAGFQEQGRFVPDRYHRYLRAIGISPQEFERLLRDDLRIKKLTEGVKASVSVTDEAVRAAYAKAHEQLTGSVLLAETRGFLPRVRALVTEADTRAYYAAHPDEFRTEEQLAIEYAGATRAELSERMSVPDGELAAFYEQHAQEFAAEDGTPPPLDQIRDAVRQRATEERVREHLAGLALDLAEDVEAGRSFDELVSARGLTRRAAGPFPVGTPWVAGGPEPAILQAVTGLGEGQMSDLIETDNGLYVARVTQRIPSRVPPFEEIHATVEERLVEALARQAARASLAAQRDALLAKQAEGLRFEEAVLAVGVSPTATQPFTRTGSIDPIGLVPALNEAAFATPLGQLSEVVDLPVGYAVIRPEERLPLDESKLPDEQASLRQQLLSEQETQRLQGWLAELRTRAKLRSFVDSPMPFTASGP